MTDDLLEYDIDIIHVPCMYHLVFRQKDQQTGALLYQCPRCGKWFVFYEYKPTVQEGIPAQNELPKKRKRRKKQEEEEQTQQVQPQEQKPEDYYIWQSETVDENGNPVIRQINPKYLKTDKDNKENGEQTNADL
ncbi:MAG: hypothetical protein QXP36_08720 [Conexivisphaerales archaeon]|uniref:hypothetical protein n=1 Tax=Sulfolobaceae TaxID=118883 RepID=UPI003174BF29